MGSRRFEFPVENINPVPGDLEGQRAHVLGVEEACSRLCAELPKSRCVYYRGALAIIAEDICKTSAVAFLEVYVLKINRLRSRIESELDDLDKGV